MEHTGQQGIGSRKSLMPVYILSILVVAALIVMIVALCKPRESVPGVFMPPPFENAAVVGIPDVPDGLGYSSPYREGMAYRFSICGNVKMEGRTAILYFTNDAGNDVYIKLRVLDSEGNMLGETGLIKPGEYVHGVELNQALAVGSAVTLKIMGYEPETYMSAGSVVLNTEIG